MDWIRHRQSNSLTINIVWLRQSGQVAPATPDRRLRRTVIFTKAEYANNAQSFEDYYDEIEVSDAASRSHFKAAILIRNREMIDRSDLVVCFVERKSGGAFAALQYAQKKKVINLAEDLVLYAE